MMSQHAEKILDNIFGRKITNHYIAAYKNRLGQEIALERKKATGIYIWVKNYDSDADLQGVSIRNQKNPNQPYMPAQPRTSGLNGTTAPTLATGTKAWYLQIDSIANLKELLSWCDRI